mgnify:CR=1 FL=1
MEKNVFVHPSALVDPGAEIGEGTKVWHFTHLMPSCQVGMEVTLARMYL